MPARQLRSANGRFVMPCETEIVKGYSTPARTRLGTLTALLATITLACTIDLWPEAVDNATERFLILDALRAIRCPPPLSELTTCAGKATLLRTSNQADSELS